jgi:hypothetical protein
MYPTPIRQILLLVLLPAFGCEPSTGQATQPSSPAPGMWVKHQGPVLTGQFGIASDPAVRPLPAGGYRMAYTGLDPALNRTVICSAESRDGLVWRRLDTGGDIQGMVLRGTAGLWDENLETAAVIDRGTDQLLIYTGYRDEGKPAKGFPASLGIAKSAGPGSFERVSDKPALEPTAGGFDNDGIYSPRVIRDVDHWLMVYTGHAYTNDPQSGRIGVRILAAASKDAIAWEKVAEPVLATKAELPWTADGVAGPCLVQGPDHQYYLFFTGLKDEQRVIGLARGPSPLGPWQVAGQPILTPSPDSFDEHQVLAPCVIIEGSRVRMWYLGVDNKEHLACGYAESRWPL